MSCGTAEMQDLSRPQSGKGVRLKVEQGEVVGVLGPIWVAGKTTSFYAIVG